ncbi:MAG: hypothetical protein ABL931_22970, partial [Usitatibacteraceae bacterium]
MSIQRFHVGPRLSEMAIHNGTIYLAGQVADDTSQDISGQTRQILASIDTADLRARHDMQLAMVAESHAKLDLAR